MTGCAVLPLLALSIYISVSMESFIQKQLSEEVVQNISRNERNIYDGLQNMAYYTNGVIFDQQMQSYLMDPEVNVYQAASYFHTLVERNGLITTDDLLSSAKIILFDNYGNCYSNWELNYQSYFYLLEEDWIKEASEGDGHIVWNMLNPAYAFGDGENEQYISLARAVMDLRISGEKIGTLIMSINKSAFSKLVMEYAYEEDMAYICIDDGVVLMDNDTNEWIQEQEIHAIYDKTKENRNGSLRETAGDREYLISYYTLRKPWQFSGQDMKVFHFTNYAEISSYIGHLQRKIHGVVFIVVCITILFLRGSIRLAVRPIVKLTNQMNEYTIDSEIRDLDTERSDEIGDLNRAFLRMSDNLKSAFSRANEEREIKEYYRYESLRAQMNPHFLFNTLNSIRWMAVIRGAENIVESIDVLARLLKYSFRKEKDQITVRDEIENIRSYVSIQNMRYGEHVCLEVDLEEEVLDLGVAKFILQPIVENSILHGFDSRVQKILHIYVYGGIEGEDLILYIEDDGCGITPEAVQNFAMEKNQTHKEKKMTGIGLHHVDECIRITYGTRYGLEVKSRQEQAEEFGEMETGAASNMQKGTIVKFILPCIAVSDQASKEEK